MFHNCTAVAKLMVEVAAEAERVDGRKPAIPTERIWMPTANSCEDSRAWRKAGRSETRPRRLVRIYATYSLFPHLLLTN